MDVAKYKAICKAISADLDQLAKKYDLSNYGFMGFVGAPGSGHTPVFVHSITKAQWQDHPHILLSRAAFLKLVDSISSLGGNTYHVTSHEHN